MVFLKFVALVALIMFNISFAMRNEEVFYDKLREQAVTCKTGRTYEVNAGGCRTSCDCVALGIMKCDENECESNGDGENFRDTEIEPRTIFDRLRDDATNCAKGQEIDTEGCGKCTCVKTGILNCQFRATCLPKQANKYRRQEVSNVIIG